MDYSDSDESGDEQTDIPSKTPSAKHAPSTNANFKFDRSNPQKIQVRLNNAAATNGAHEDEPTPKRQRLGGGGLSDFNAMLPPPKRDAEKPQMGNKTSARKVFSLKTGAEPGFSRESDAELRQFFADQDAERVSNNSMESGNAVGLPDIPKRNTDTLSRPSEQPLKGNAFMFKPLSVARNTKKKKPAALNGKQIATSVPLGQSTPEAVKEKVASQPKKVSLFSSNAESDATEVPQETDLLDGVVEESHEVEQDPDPPPFQSSIPTQNAQSLDTIASDLNLSAAERRQLFGRGGKGASAAALNVVNFNTDAEYAANEELRATGEQQQHNPLRAIAPGKHNLKQLVSNAQGQKDALEESFAQGKRNKKEAGNKYGW